MRVRSRRIYLPRVFILLVFLFLFWTVTYNEGHEQNQDTVQAVLDSQDNSDDEYAYTSSSETTDDPRIPLYWINLDSRTDRRQRMEASYTTHSPWLQQVVNFNSRVSAFHCQEVYDLLTTTTAATRNSLRTVVAPTDSASASEEKKLVSQAAGCWSDAHPAKFLAGYPEGLDEDGSTYTSRAAAQQACVQYGEKCGGIVSGGAQQWEVRAGRTPYTGPPHETSYVKLECPAVFAPITTKDNQFCHYRVPELSSAFPGRGAGTTELLRLVEIATTMSHILAIAVAYHETTTTDQQAYAIILEDDVMLDNVDRINRFRPAALQRLATKMRTAFDDTNEANWLVHLYCNNANRNEFLAKFLLEPPNVILKPTTCCLGAQMYMLSHAAMKGILTVFVPDILPILKDITTRTATTSSSNNRHEMRRRIKTMVHDNFSKLLLRDSVECIVEAALYRNVNYFTTTRPFGYQLSGTSNLNPNGVSVTPESLFDQFYSSTEERQNEVYEPITDWIGPVDKDKGYWFGPVDKDKDAVAVTTTAGATTTTTPPAACSKEAILQDPTQFKNCIREDTTSPSCNPQLTKSWDQWVGNRYKKYGGKCITPELMKETGETWAISGPGSTLAATKEVRTLLATLFADPTLQIRTFLDCPCGDWLWMQAVDLSSVHYFGADITEETVRENTKCFAQETVQFATLDWSCAIPPPVDLIMIRDVLFHLSTANNLDILRHVNASGAKYLLTTTFPNKSHAAVDNYDIGPKVGFRNINLYGPPYNFPDPPLRKTGIEVGQGVGRHMALWKLPLPLPL